MKAESRNSFGRLILHRKTCQPAEMAGIMEKIKKRKAGMVCAESVFKNPALIRSGKYGEA